MNPVAHAGFAFPLPDRSAPGRARADEAAPAGFHPGQVGLILQGDDNYGVGRVGREIATLVPGVRCVAFCRGVECDVLESMGVNVHVLPSGEFFRAFSPRRGFLGAIRQLAHARPWWHRCARELEAWVRAHGVRVLHGNVIAHYFTLAGLRGAGEAACRTIWHVHNYLNVDRQLGISARFVWRQARRGADRIVCVSRAMAAGWGGSRVPIHVIHNCVPSRSGGPASAATRPPPGGPLRIVACGRMEWSKGLHVAVEAMGRLRDAGVPARLDVYGGPLEGNPYVAAMRARVRELELEDRVRFPGYVHDLPERLPRYDLAMQCRIDPEPCSIYVLECMHAGVPLIASNNGGTPELVRDGREGWLYPPGDVDAVAGLLAGPARDAAQRARLGLNARARACSVFSPERFAASWRDLYAELAAARGVTEDAIR